MLTEQTKQETVEHIDVHFPKDKIGTTPTYLMTEEEARCYIFLLEDILRNQEWPTERQLTNYLNSSYCKFTNAFSETILSKKREEAAMYLVSLILDIPDEEKKLILMLYQHVGCKCLSHFFGCVSSLYSGNHKKW